MPHVWLSQQIVEEIERCRVEPLQIIEEQGQRMLRPREHANQSPEDQLKATLRVLRWKVGDRWLLAEDQRQLGDQIHHEPGVRTQSFAKGVSPGDELIVALREKTADEAAKRLCQRRVRNVALVLIALSRREQAAGWNQDRGQLSDDGGFADP